MVAPLLFAPVNAGPQPGARSGGMSHGGMLPCPTIYPATPTFIKAAFYQSATQAGDPIISDLAAPTGSNAGGLTSAPGNVPGQTGDLVIIGIEITPTASSVDPGVPTIDGSAISASGWTLLGGGIGLSSFNGTSPGTRLTVVAKVRAGGDPDQITWGWSGTATGNYSAGGIAIAAGTFDTTTPIEGDAIQNQASSSTTFPFPSITTTVRGLIVEFAGNRSNGGWTMPAQLRQEFYTSSSSNIAIGTEDIQGAGTYNLSAIFGSATSVGQTAILSVRANAGGSDIAATANLTATSTLTTSAFVERFIAIALSAISTLTTTAVVSRAATAALTATSTLTATAGVVKPATATLTATSTLTATADLTRNATAALSATSTLTVSANTTVNATATLSATSTLTAAATREQFATAALSATSTLTTTAVVTKLVTVALNATSTLTTTATLTRNATAALTATSTLTATAVVEKLVTISLTATSTLTAVSGSTINATAALTATSTLTVTTFVERFATIALTASSALIVTASVPGPSIAGFAGWGVGAWGMVAWGASYLAGNAPAAAILTATSTLTATPFVVRQTTVTFTATSTLTATATKISSIAAIANLMAVSILTASGAITASAIWIELVVNNGVWSLASVSTNPYVENIPGAPVYSQVTPTGSTWIEFPVAPRSWS